MDISFDSHSGGHVSGVEYEDKERKNKFVTIVKQFSINAKWPLHLYFQRN